jgi:hypothetical protein
MMTAETWMSARQAVAYGFADEVLAGGNKDEGGGMKAENVAFVNCLRSYANVPPDVMQAYQFMNIPEAAEPSKPVLTEDMQREAQNLRSQVRQILGGKPCSI